MNFLDWSIVAFYMVGMVGLSVWLGRTQRTGNDYFLGGNRIGHWAIGTSILATQCSTNSLMGAPAFVIAVGGLLWLQYELAVPSFCLHVLPHGAIGLIMVAMFAAAMSSPDLPPTLRPGFFCPVCPGSGGTSAAA